MNKFTLAALAALILVPASAFAIPESQFSTLFGEVDAYYQSSTAGQFLGKDGVTIRYRMFPAQGTERGALVISNGRTESYVKYAELFYDLRNEGWTIYALDHRGQGESGRMTRNPQVGYVRHFSDYVDDLKRFVEVVVNATPHSRRVLLGHSMGGAIAASYAERFPKDFDGFVLSSPMLQINTAPYAAGIARAITVAGVGLGLGKSYAIGYGPYAPAVFEKQTMTHSRARNDKSNAQVAEEPSIALGGPSFRWVNESLAATSKIVAGAKSVTAPVLLLRDGQDSLVKPGGQDKFCAAALSCRKVEYATAYHELLNETDSIRDQALGEVTGFLRSLQ
jgi:lysophospholipase